MHIPLDVQRSCGVSRLAGASQLASAYFRPRSPRLDFISASATASTAASVQQWRRCSERVWPSICIYWEATNPMHIQAGIHAVDDDNPDFRSFRDGEGERSFEHIVRL